MKDVKAFMEQAFPKFEEMLEGDIIDLFFLYVQSDKELMKAYLDTVADIGDLREVNRQIALAISRKIQLSGNGVRNYSPKSSLIQSYSELGKKE